MLSIFVANVYYYYIGYVILYDSESSFFVVFTIAFIKMLLLEDEVAGWLTEEESGTKRVDFLRFLLPMKGIAVGVLASFVLGCIN